MLYGYIIIGQAHTQLIFDGKDLNAAGSVSGQWLSTFPGTPRTPLCLASAFAVDIKEIIIAGYGLGTCASQFSKDDII
jgi:hypothetical protein